MPELQDKTLCLANHTLFTNVGEGLSAEPDATGAGLFIVAQSAKPFVWKTFTLGKLESLERFTSCQRYDPFWMKPIAGTTCEQVKDETQFFLARRTDGLCVLVVPLFDNVCRFTLGGGKDGLTLSADTGDPYTQGKGGVAAFVSIGADPYALVETGAAAVAKRLDLGPLRKEKPVPDFADQFGWCTWDSFYREVAPDKVRAGLESFAAGGVEPRFIILDDGWQDYHEPALGGERLTSMNANAKFNGTLEPTVKMAKGEFKIKTFIVWHALGGYWSGVELDRFPAYKPVELPRNYPHGIASTEPLWNHAWGSLIGVVPPDQIGRFFDDYHRLIRSWGVDGVKVDNQATIEGLTHKLGGRVAMFRAYRNGLEASVQKHFDGRLINCMSNNNETHLLCRGSLLLRTSTDFWPLRPETHGQHLYTNAHVGVWFGQFILPDWDMFQSGHAMGAFHAAGRAVSGAPVYVSDKPDGHDFAVLRKLVFSDGTTARCDGPGVPTPDCLFNDPTSEDVLFKVQNYNRDAAIVGLFNCRYHPDAADRHAITGRVSPADAPRLTGDVFAAFTHRGNTLRRLSRTESQEITLNEGEWELVTLAPIKGGIGVIGLADKMNSGGAIVQRTDTPTGCDITLRDGGELVAWCEKKPTRVEVGGKSVGFEYAAADHRLTVTLGTPGRQVVRVVK